VSLNDLFNLPNSREGKGLNVLRSLLDEQQTEILSQERTLLEDLRVLLARLDAGPDDQRHLSQALRQLEELFLLVVVGEFNSGKSAFINALLGQPVLEEGVTPTTDRVHLLRYGPALTRTARDEDLLVVTWPVAWLRDINIVDTPGTNSVLQRHQAITEDFIPRSDLVLFITSIDRPFTESERVFLERVRDWGKKIVVVINKIDVLEDEASLSKVVQFVEDNAQLLLGLRPPIFPVSARLAQKAKASIGAEREALWQASRFAALEEFILNTLDERQRVRLKLENPLGVADRLHTQYLSNAQARLELLREDFKTLDDIQDQLIGYEEDLRRNFADKLSRVDNVLLQVAARGTAFFDDTVRLTRVFHLIHTDQVRAEFEQKVIADAVPQIEAQVRDLIDWLVDRDFRQWQGVMAHVNRRAAQHHDRIVGQVGGQFEHNRQERLASVERAAREAVASYDRTKEAAELAESVQRAVAQTALVEVGAIGLGALLVAILHASMADFSGVLMAGAVATLGFFILPARRRAAKKQLKTQLETLRVRLAEALTSQFERELSLSLQRIRAAIAPYTIFVQTERDKLGEIEDHLVAASAKIQTLHARIKDL
jgi:small GTP-binding protein